MNQRVVESARLWHETLDVIATALDCLVTLISSPAVFPLPFGANNPFGEPTAPSV